MAFTSGNRDGAFGFRPAYHFTGGTIRPSMREIADDYSSAIYFGDPVKSDGNGRINVCAAGDTMLGIFAGVHYIADDGEVKFSNRWVASTSILTGTKAMAVVYDDPNIVFEIQADEDVVQADIGATADIATYAEGSATTGVSAVELDSSNIGTGAGLKIIGYPDRPDNVLGSNFTKVYVLLNEHENRGTLTAT
jgi:hypothetical protein